MADVNVVVNVFTAQENKEVAKIALNGYNIAEGGTFGISGAMRSFKIVEGEVWNFWSDQTPLTIRDKQGKEAQIRIFALPAEQGASGFVEFL